ncbi:hypothetical protein FE257_012801 [Aspergillus nanangensis]|uniref:Heterokaryon incompatibility domain-containing protein n=1 Tax=Aspergillus nanangensis TaxID=2582783 RepID=A0AAD4GQK9_ASPNN|nr:hypothetical protein FE257_012801 [Aspergillus nanangensis]
MRLISTNPPLQLHEFSANALPKYAILSHRWGRDEVSFQEMLTGRNTNTAGYDKIQKFCARAAKDGWEYAWIDTCCINKESSAELSEAINSMFAWYSSAEVCYAYLHDVDPSPSRESFSHSEWFKRGWTLQELIAPTDVRFLSSNWSDLGSKSDLSSLLSEITEIEEDVLLKKSPLEDFSIAKRMCWASRRDTTRVEDRAYSLMGIFDINMPLLYGEGPKAFIRLQEEIIKHYDDQTLFVWDSDGDTNPEDYTSGLLAESPSNFKNSGDVVPVSFSQDATPFSITVLHKIPRPGHHKRLVLCFDSVGVLGNTIPTSNVEMIHELAGLTRSPQQISWYHAGAYDTTLKASVLDGYKFLMKHYILEDKIYLFGFSKGASAANLLGLLVFYVGILPGRNHDGLLTRVWAHFMKALNAAIQGETVTQEFRIPAGQQVAAEFMGLFDRVDTELLTLTTRSSESYLMAKADISLTCPAQRIRHAVSIDERRAAFRPRLIPPETMRLAIGLDKDKIEEVWFAGSHNDIGGQYLNDRELSLGALPLNWMTYQAALNGLTLPFQHTFSRLQGWSRTSVNKHWLLEYLPHHSMGVDAGCVTSQWIIPRGRPRIIPYDATVHGSFIEKLSNEPKYLPLGIRSKDGDRVDGIGTWYLLHGDGDPIEACFTRQLRSANQFN